MKKKIIAAGHTCLDIAPVFHTKKQYQRIGDLLEPGKLIQMDEAKIHTGGSVPNTGLALKLLGNEVELLGKVGNDAFGGAFGGAARSHEMVLPRLARALLEG